MDPKHEAPNGRRTRPHRASLGPGSAIGWWLGPFALALVAACAVERSGLGPPLDGDAPPHPDASANLDGEMPAVDASGDASPDAVDASGDAAPAADAGCRCAWGCGVDGACVEPVVPNLAAGDAPSRRPGERDLVLADDATIHTGGPDEGQIATSGAVVRNAGRGEVDGIELEVRTQSGGAPELAIFIVRSLTIEAGVTVSVLGQRPLVFIASGPITIDGILDVSASDTQPGPGGWPPDQGLGAGDPGATSGSTDTGGGGGGHGGSGGAGGDCCPANEMGGAGGAPYGALLEPLVGGSGGGEGWDPDPGAAGGAGGGAVQLVSDAAIRIGGDGGVHAGGGGGVGGSNTGDGGGGGGSGGAVLLVAPSVVGMGTVAANGGGGGGGNRNAGSDGALGVGTSPGGVGGSSGGGAGGDGGGAAAIDGTAGTGTAASGGGGGGGAGRIRVITRDGAVDSALAWSPSSTTPAFVVEAVTPR